MNICTKCGESFSEPLRNPAPDVYLCETDFQNTDMANTPRNQSAQHFNGYMDAMSGREFGAYNVYFNIPALDMEYRNGWNAGRVRKHGPNVCKA